MQSLQIVQTEMTLEAHLSISKKKLKGHMGKLNELPEELKR